MDYNRSLDRQFQSVAWGVLFILFGSLSLIPGEQNDVFVLGVGLILLGLNAARYVRRLPLNAVTLVLGLMAFAVGAAALGARLLDLPRVTLDLWPLLLIALGVGGLIQVIRRPVVA
jgi:uncharacterized membrane protein